MTELHHNILKRLPLAVQPIVKHIYRDWAHIRKVWWRVQMRHVREILASLAPTSTSSASTQPKVVYMTGMPRTGSSLAKNFLGDSSNIRVMKFQPSGFTNAWKIAQNEQAIVLDKATHYLRNLKRIYRAYGNQIAFFCIIRDPRDILNSLNNTLKHREIPRDNTFWQIWAQNYSNYFQFAASHPWGEKRCYLIRYEDLARWPEKAKADFFCWLGLDTKDVEITPHYHIIHEDDTQDWKVEEKSSVSAESIGKWKDNIEADKYSMFLRWHDDEQVRSLMHSLGYVEGGVVNHSVELAGLRVFSGQKIS